MENLNLHIVSFNVPYPPNCGGLIDVFYKIQSLNNYGVQVHLHCFEFGKKKQPELEKICARIFYYKGNKGLFKTIHKLPYLVKMRSDSELLNNLIADDYPILFEGLYTTFFLDSPQLKNRIKIVRMHNIEHNYFNILAQQEKKIARRLFYRNTAKKFENYEPVLSNSTHIAAISPNDFHYFSKQYNNAFWLPPFHSNTEINVFFGSGTYALFHGNLSVRENVKAALFLINAFRETETIQIVIAGNSPAEELVKICEKIPHIKLISKPTELEMQKLITEAHVQLMPSFQPTGLKLKLINSLFRGRHCLVNDTMVSGTGLENLCHKANTSDEFVAKTRKLMALPFESDDLILRKEILSKRFDNQRNAALLVSKIFGINQ